MKVQARDQFPVLLKVAAVLLAVTGQIILAKHVAVALGLWLVALALTFLSLRKSLTSPLPDLVVNPLSNERITDWGCIAGVVAVALCCASFYLFTTDLPNILAWTIHILSVILVLLAVTVFSTHRIKKAHQLEKWQRMEIVAFAAVLLLGGFLRFYRLSQMPFGFWYDEAENGLNALQILNSTTNFPVFYISLPNHLIYLMAASIKIFGQTVFAVRAVCALIGMATVAAAFLVGRELFNKKTGLILALLLAVSRWDIVHSRMGMHGITVPLFELLTIGLLLRAFRLQRFRDYLFAGLSLGLGLCSYVPFRLFPVIVMLLFALVWVTHHDFVKNHWQHILVFLFGAIVISVPITQFAVTHSQEFWGRTNQVSVFSNRTFEEGFKTVIKTTGEHLAMFNYKGDRNGRHNIPAEPMLDLVSGGLLILGIGMSLFCIKKPLSILLLFWLLFMLAPGILSLDFESPQSLRAIGSLPAAYLLACLPFNALLDDQKSLFKKKPDVLINSVLILGLLTAGSLNVYNYFVREANNSSSWLEHSTPDTIIAREMNLYENNAEYFVSTFYCNTPTIRYLAPSVKDFHCIETHATFPFLLDGERDAIFFLDLDRKPVYEQLKKYYPTAVFTEHQTPGGSSALYEVFLTKTDIQSFQGLTAHYYTDAGMDTDPFKTAVLRELNADWSTSDPGLQPFYADISGLLFADVYGVYRFTLSAPAEAAIYLDGSLVVQGEGGALTGSTELACGLHTIEIKAEGTYGNLHVTWQPPEGEKGEIPPANLFLPPLTNNGLLGSYYPNADWQGEPVLRQIDPFIHFYYHNPPLQRPYTVEWVGQINIEEAGTYEFGTEAIDTSQLYLDGNLVVDNQTLNQYQGNQIELSEGMHDIKLRFSDLTGHTHINLYWKPPDAEKDYIPSEVLFLP